jgi:outer membrane immunogenic protein
LALRHRNYFNTLGPNLLGTAFDQDASGVTGGGQLGFDFQTGAWVFGVEGSAAATDLADSHRSPFFPGFDVYTTDISWLAAVTGRAGYARDRWLVYAKGGWAGADTRLNWFEANTGIRASSTAWANGWTAGGGAEYALSRRLSLAIEYDYVALDTGRWKLPCTGCGSGVGLGAPVVDGDIAIQSVMARLNYRFGG